MRDGGSSFDGMSRGQLVEELKKLYQPKTEIIKHYQDVVPYFRGMIENEKQEYFLVMHLDDEKRVLEKKVVFIGTLNRSLVHPREVFQGAIVKDVKKIIVGHNHPSGNTQPSLEDIEMTSRLQKAGRILGVELVDHVIITATSSYSFHSHGRI